jgi:hypothetical protein
MPDETPHQKTKDFRFVFANTFGLKMSDGDVTLMLGHEEQFSATDKTVYEEVGVNMTHRAAKLLSVLLTEAVRDFEDANGPIPLAQEKVDKITATFANARAKRQEAHEGAETT